MKEISRFFLTVSDQKTLLRLSTDSVPGSYSNEFEISLQEGEEFAWNLTVFTPYGYYERKYSINITKRKIAETDNAETVETFILTAYVDDERDIHISLHSPSSGNRKNSPHMNYLRTGWTDRMEIDGKSFAIEVGIKSIRACNYDRDKDDYYYNEECYDYRCEWISTQYACCF